MSGAATGRIEGKIALITGAASGIGLATSQIMAAQGGSVVLTDLNTEPGDRAAQSINESGGTAIFRNHDVTSENDWISVLEFVEKMHGRLDILVNNAGVGTTGSIEETTLEQWRAIHAVNSEGPFLG